MSAEATGDRPRVALVAPLPESAYPLAAMLERGWDVHVVADGWNGSGCELAAGLPVERLHTPLRSGSRPTRVQTAISVARGTRRQPLAGWREVRSPSRRTRIARAMTIGLAPQVLHVPSRAVARDWSGVAAVVGARMVVSVSSDEAIAMSFEDRTASLPVSALHVERESVAALLNGTASGTAVSVIPPVPDRVLLAEQPVTAPPTRPLRILGIGPLSWTQGYEHALLAVKLLADRGIPCEYRIAGRGEYRDAISFARHQLGLDGRVELVEPRSRAELRDLVRWAGVLVDASVVPTSPKPILDAHAAGVPVITTERAAHGNAVLVVPRRDPRGLCDALAALAGEETLGARLATAGRKRALQAPDEAEQAGLFGDLFLAALGRPVSSSLA